MNPGSDTAAASRRLVGLRASEIHVREDIVDESAGLCYAMPPEWSPATAQELADGPYSTGAGPTSDDDASWIGVGLVDDITRGELDEDDPVEIARAIAADFAATSEGEEPIVTWKTWSIGRRDAATATAVGDLFPVTVQVTIVEAEHGLAALVSSGVGRSPNGLELFNPIHDTIAAT